MAFPETKNEIYFSYFTVVQINVPVCDVKGLLCMNKYIGNIYELKYIEFKTAFKLMNHFICKKIFQPTCFDIILVGEN